MTPTIIAFAIVCTTAPTPTVQPFPNDYTWPSDCLAIACPNITAQMNDYKAAGKKLKLDDVLDLGYMSKWHAAQCVGRG
jgi:hypothetical protein